MCKKSEFCDTCPHCRKVYEEYFSKLYESDSYSYFCGQLNTYIDYYLSEGENVIVPNNCPLKNDDNDNKYLDMLKHIPNRMTWNMIQKGEKYHLPPLNGNDRMDVEVTYKTEYSCTVKLLKGTSTHPLGKLITWYPQNWEYKFLVKNKSKCKK